MDSHCGLTYTPPMSPRASSAPSGGRETGLVAVPPLSGWLAVLAPMSCGFAAAFVWLLLERMRGGAPHGDALGVGVHLVRLALPVGTVLGALLHGISVLERRSPTAARLAVVLLATAPSFTVARSLADGEGVSDGPFPSSLVVALGTVAFVSVTTGVLALASTRRRTVGPILALVASVGLAVVAAIAARTYERAALLAYSVATLGLASVMARAILAERRRAVAAAVSLAIASLLALVAPTPREPRFESGRRSVQLSLGVGATVDAFFSAPDRRVTRRVRFAVPPRGSFSCPRPAPRVALDHPPIARNVVIVSIDSVRRAALDTRWRGRDVMPNARALSRRALVPERAYTTYPATFFALAGAFTGLPPGRILLATVPPRSLLSTLAREVERTVAIVPSARYFRRADFGRYVLQDVDVRSASDAQSQVDETLGFVREARARDERFAVWVHFYEPHHRYVPHPGFEFGAESTSLYYGEVAYADAALGRLVDSLRAEGGLEDTLFVFFADHGEALGERGHEGHHVYLDSWIAEVPLALVVPGTEGRTVPGAAAVIDVAPTVLRAMGIAPPHAMEGQVLLSPLAPERAIVAESFSTGGPALARFSASPVRDEAELRRRMDLYARAFDRYPGSVSLTQGRHRLIVWRETGVVQLFDRVADPAEEHDLYRALPDVRERMLASLERWHREQSIALVCELARSESDRP